MDIIVDTQVLSYRFKGSEKEVQGNSLAISSITASEFLEAQPKESKQPDYYIIHPARYPYFLHVEGSSFSIADHFGNPKWAKMGTRRTDQMIIDFGHQFSAYREYGNEAISEIINENKLEFYKLSISHLPKEKQKYLLKRMNYILDSGYYCYALTKTVVDNALNLFSEFVSQHNCKGNIRNSVNDILILSTAIDREKKLLTRDNLLNRFAAEYYEVAVYKDNDEILIDFSEDIIKEKRSRESKEYINKGWSYAISQNRASHTI